MAKRRQMYKTFEGASKAAERIGHKVGFDEYQDRYFTYHPDLATFYGGK